MFTTPKKALTKLRAHPYLSPLKLFGLTEPTVTPVSSPGGYPVPPPSPFNPRISTTPTPRKRHGVYRGPWSSPLKPKPFRPVAKGYHRVGMRRIASRQSLRMRRSTRSLGKAKAARDSRFVGLSRAAFNTANHVRTPLTHEDRIFLKELANLGLNRKIATSLAEARAAADRAAELAPQINAEREAKAHASLAREKEQQQAFATQREAEVAAEAAVEREQVDKVTGQGDELFTRQQRLFKLGKQRRREEALRRQQREQLQDHLRFQNFFQESESRHKEELRQQAERDRLAREQEARRHDEAVARFREEQEAFRKKEEERTRLENERLAQEQRDAEAFINAALRFQKEAQDRLQREQAARLQAEQQARAWFEAAQQAGMAANHARPQGKSCGFEGVDVSMMDASMHADIDASMRIDMDASMRTAPPYSPPPTPSPPPPLTVADRFALYERKWTALKSDVPILSFDLLPWPILHDVSAPEDITEERMFEFFYHPERPGYRKKTVKERSRIELLRWHPDKFLGKVLGKVDEEHRAMVEEVIGQVSRFLVRSAAS